MPQLCAMYSKYVYLCVCVCVVCVCVCVCVCVNPCLCCVINSFYLGYSSRRRG